MFQSIKGTLLRKHEDINARSSVSVIVRQAVQEYIRSAYPDAVLSVSVRYDAQEKVVIITTPSKTLAGELTMNTRELRAHLTSQNVRVNRIIAR